MKAKAMLITVSRVALLVLGIVARTDAEGAMHHEREESMVAIIVEFLQGCESGRKTRTERNTDEPSERCSDAACPRWRADAGRI